MATSYKSRYGQVTDQAQTFLGAKSFEADAGFGTNTAAGQAIGFRYVDIGQGKFRYVSTNSMVIPFVVGSNAGAVAYTLMTVSMPTLSSGNTVGIRVRYLQHGNTTYQAGDYDLYAWYGGTSPTFGTSVQIRQTIAGSPTAPTFAWSGGANAKTLTLTINPTFAYASCLLELSLRNSSGDVSINPTLSSMSLT